jgi:hypothetical protein
MDRAKLAEIVRKGVVEGFHHSGECSHGEWLADIDGEEVSLYAKRDKKSDGEVWVTVYPDDPDAEAEEKKYRLKVSVELTEIP